jgi:hypothetical protein
LGSGSLALWAGWAAGGLVVAAGVDGQVAEQFAGGGVDDADVEVVDEHEHLGSGVGWSDAEVVEAAGHTQGDHAAVVDAVVADAAVGVVVAAGGREGLGEGVVGGGGGGAGGQGPVRPLVVVDGGELVEQGLQLGEGGGLDGLGGEPLLEVCWKRSTLPQVVGWLGLACFCATCRRCSSASRALRPPLPPARRVVNTIPLSVRVDAGVPWAATAARNAARTTGPVTGAWADPCRA